MLIIIINIHGGAHGCGNFRPFYLTVVGWWRGGTSQAALIETISITILTRLLYNGLEKSAFIRKLVFTFHIATKDPKVFRSLRHLSRLVERSEIVHWATLIVKYHFAWVAYLSELYQTFCYLFSHRVPLLGIRTLWWDLRLDSLCCTINSLLLQP